MLWKAILGLVDVIGNALSGRRESAKAQDEFRRREPGAGWAKEKKPRGSVL